MSSAGVGNVSADLLKGSPRSLSDRLTHVCSYIDKVIHG
jgi:hypothetical protein